MSHDLFTSAEGLNRLETKILPNWIIRQRWFGGKSRQVCGLKVTKKQQLAEAWLLAVEVTYSDGAVEVYAIPLVVIGDRSQPANATIVEIEDGVLCDAVYDAGFRAVLLELLKGNQQVGEIAARSEHWLGGVGTNSSVMEGEQSNSAIVYDQRLFVKLYRKLNDGLNPDVEITRALKGNAFVSQFGGEINWGNASLVMATSVVANRGDTWSLALSSFSKCLASTDQMKVWLEQVELLGKRTGEMHLALLSGEGGAGFGTELLSRADSEDVSTRLKQLYQQTRKTLAAKLPDLDADTRILAEEVMSVDPQEVVLPEGVTKCRTHGDYHLGQVLDSGGDFVIIDFEGEPSRSLEQRRAKYPPARDVAGMLRSFHYAAHAAKMNDPRVTSEAAESWARESQDRFLEAWQNSVTHSKIEVSSDLIQFYVMEKAIYEIDYELNNRPDWLGIPLRGLLGLLKP